MSHRDQEIIELIRSGVMDEDEVLRIGDLYAWRINPDGYYEIIPIGSVLA